MSKAAPPTERGTAQPKEYDRANQARSIASIRQPIMVVVNPDAGMTDERNGTYAQLTQPFDQTFTDVRGGVSLEYITGEQVATRLNVVLGPGGWTFKVLKHEIHAEADEAWVLGELTADIDGTTVVRQQFGSQKIKRSRSTGSPLDIGFDLKGAATDAMKKCATLIGVGLYLSHKTQQPKPQVRTQAAPATVGAGQRTWPRPTASQGR